MITIYFFKGITNILVFVPGNSGSINLDDLEPFQKYNCSGKITHNSKVINTKSIDVEIKCSKLLYKHFLR